MPPGRLDTRRSNFWPPRSLRVVRIFPTKYRSAQIRPQTCSDRSLHGAGAEYDAHALEATQLDRGLAILPRGIAERTSQLLPSDCQFLARAAGPPLGPEQ